jgi:hypothetical protein
MEALVGLRLAPAAAIFNVEASSSVADALRRSSARVAGSLAASLLSPRRAFPVF